MRSASPFEVDIEELDPEGYGLSRERDIRVIGALPGETVIARPLTRKRGKIYAKTLSVTVPATDRVMPPCGAADICGGCSFQHLDPASQIEFKQACLMRLLGGDTPNEVLPPLRGPVFRYRVKARLGVKYVRKKGRVLVGFREKMNPFVAEIDRCEILKEPVGELLPVLGELIGGSSCPAAIPQIEMAAGDDQVALVVRHLQPLTRSDVARLIDFARDTGISFYLQPGDTASAYKIWPRHGPDRLYYQLPSSNLTFAFHPLDFVQVNLDINRKLVETALSLLALRSSDSVVDAFCGIGNFSLAIAKNAGFVRGLEVSQGSLARAQENRKSNRIENCEFEDADLLAENPDKAIPGDANKLLLDPPRTGAECLVKKLASSKVERVVYISCNPHTLARDTKLLVESGYRFEKAGVLDMFPHTTHIESIALYTRSQ